MPACVYPYTEEISKLYNALITSRADSFIKLRIDYDTADEEKADKAALEEIRERLRRRAAKTTESWSTAS